MAATLRHHAMFRWRDLVNLAGALTLARLPLAVAFLFVEPGFGIWLYAAGLLTDVVDGEVARRLGQRSDAGSFADGLCDKIFHGTVALVLTLGWGLVPAWWLLAWFSREIVQVATLPWVLAQVRAAPDRRRHANELGKLTSVLLSMACGAVLLGWIPAAGVFTAATGVIGAFSGVAYTLRERE